MTHPNGRIAAYSVLAAFFVLKLWYILVATPLPDEAYYWLWGQRLGLSYYDHPPLQAWVQRLSAEVLGQNLFALRFPALVSSAVLIGCCAYWARVLTAMGRPYDPLVAAAALFASPLLFIFTTIVFNDHLMIALLSLAVIFAHKSLTAVQKTGAPGRREMLATGLLLGLAILAKYVAALLAVALVLGALLRRDYRPIFRAPILYVAMGLGLLCLLPILIWNAQNGAASFQYNLSDRLGDDLAFGAHLRRGAQFLVIFLTVSSPFVGFALLRVLRRPAPEIPRAMILAAFFVSTLVCLWMARNTFVLYYWNIVALIPLMPFVGLFLGKRWLLWLHYGFGLLVSTAFVVNSTVIPLSALSGQADAETALLYGWDQITPQFEAQMHAQNACMAVASDYRHGAILAFETGRRDVIVLSDRISQFTLWQAAQPTDCANAVILADEWHPLSPAITAQFDQIDLKATLHIERFGRAIATYQIYHAHGAPLR